ncbi:MAG TPA: DMT family transporter [Candidatus Limnocylindria bacterium]|nr:DMT family transporter [Candidatus Limnocylindria bacterium]
MDRATLLAFAGVVLLGGLNGVGVAIVNEEIAPLWGAALRFGSASAILFAIAAARRIGLPRGSALLGSLAYGVLYFGIGFGLIHWALVDAPPGMTQVVLAVVPLAALLLAVAHHTEPLGWRPLIGAVLAVLGVAFVFGERLGSALPAAVLLAILGGALGIAYGTVVAKRFPGSHPVAGNAVAMGVGSALILGASMVVSEPWTLLDSTGAWLWFGYLVVIGSVVVFVLFLYVVGRWTASATSYVWPLLPLVAIPFSALVTRESVTPRLVVGGAFVLAGVYLGAFAPAARTEPS